MSKDIKDRLTDALISAFTFAAALSWGESLLAIVDYYIPNDIGRLWADLIITVVITIIVISIIYFVLKANQVANNTFKVFSEDDEKNKKYE